MHLSGWIPGPQLYINTNLKYWVFFLDKISSFQTLSNCLSLKTLFCWKFSIQILSPPPFWSDCFNGLRYLGKDCHDGSGNQTPFLRSIGRKPDVSLQKISRIQTQLVTASRASTRCLSAPTGQLLAFDPFLQEKHTAFGINYQVLVFSSFDTNSIRLLDSESGSKHFWPQKISGESLGCFSFLIPMDAEVSRYSMYILAASVLWGISDTLRDQLIVVDTDGLSGRIGSEKLPSGKSKMPMQQRFWILLSWWFMSTVFSINVMSRKDFTFKCWRKNMFSRHFRKQRLTVCQFYLCHSISSTPSETQQPFQKDLRDKKRKDQIQKAWTWVQSPGLFWRWDQRFL